MRDLGCVVKDRSIKCYENNVYYKMMLGCEKCFGGVSNELMVLTYLNLLNAGPSLDIRM